MLRVFGILGFALFILSSCSIGAPLRQNNTFIQYTSEVLKQEGLAVVFGDALVYYRPGVTGALPLQVELRRISNDQHRAVIGLQASFLGLDKLIDVVPAGDYFLHSVFGSDGQVTASATPGKSHAARIESGDLNIKPDISLKAGDVVFLGSMVFSGRGRRNFEILITAEDSVEEWKAELKRQMPNLTTSFVFRPMKCAVCREVTASQLRAAVGQ